MADEKIGQQSGAYHHEKKQMIDPVGLRLDVLIAYYENVNFFSRKNYRLYVLCRSAATLSTPSRTRSWVCGTSFCPPFEAIALC